VGYRTGGQKCYVGFVPARSRRSESLDIPKEAALSPAEVARELHVDERTVRRWVTAGVIPADHTTAGHHLVSASTLQALQQLAKAKVPLNTRTLRGRFEQIQEDRQPTG
jgi:transposase